MRENASIYKGAEMELLKDDSFLNQNTKFYDEHEEGISYLIPELLKQFNYSRGDPNEDGMMLNELIYNTFIRFSVMGINLSEEGFDDRFVDFIVRLLLDMIGLKEEK